MTWALWLLMLQGILGALDTLYYHEWRARLVAYGPGTSPELRLVVVATDDRAEQRPLHAERLL